MSSIIRNAVSKSKRRYQKDGFDLDLSYITPNLIAMGFPSEAVEGVYRNPMKEVFRFLELKHKDKYKVYNLCSERSYDITKFHNRVEVFPFDDHNAPPFALIFDFCKNVKDWLSEHPDNVAVIHCKAGKGRTGLMICAYLVYSQFYASANEAMNFYAAMRTHNQKGVTIPSQIRYVRYFADTATQIEGKAVLVNPEPRPLLLTSFELVTIPKAAHFNDIRFSVYVLKTLVYTHKDPPRLKNAKKKKSKTKTEFKDDTDDGLETLVFEVPNVPIMGDIRVEFFASEKLFSFWFNTYFTTLAANSTENGAPVYTVELAKEDLDDSAEQVRKWMSTMTSKAVSNESKNYVVQLSSVVSFLNRPARSEEAAEINWDQWRNEIFTEGLVDKVKANYETLTSEEYNVENVITQLVSTPSKELEEITNELFYHGAVWMNAYTDYSVFLYDLGEYGNSNDYLMHENYDFFYGLEAELEELIETHNYFPGSKDDINLRGYYAAQFNWGKKVISFYRHPADDFKAGRATKNILGR